MPPEDDQNDTPAAAGKDTIQSKITDSGSSCVPPFTKSGDAAASPDAPRRSGAEPGREIADRYRLVERLGEGTFGEVWAADDLVLGESVALKWMRLTQGSILPRIRREIAILRMLRIPGVVRLIHDGIEDGRPFLVMERVDGRPFPGWAAPCPGTPRRWSWTSIAETTLALLEILSHVHAAGVIHRDLKPHNILVNEAGHPTILDFGISLWASPDDDRLTREGQGLGTPRYAAPEQMLDRTAVDARTDLYAVGVMLYEALTGRVPHEALDRHSMREARLWRPAPPIQTLVPDLPTAIAHVIDRLLATRIEDRFRSTTDVLAALRGEQGFAQTRPALPWLGSRRPVDAVIEAVTAGQPAYVVGPPGSGRSRCLNDAANLLLQQGRRVLWTQPTSVPLASLHPVTGVPPGHAALRLTEMTAWVQEQLQIALARGAVILADDAERVDPWSAAVLDRCSAAPCNIVRALLASPQDVASEHVVVLEPLSNETLKQLFAGPDRLFHLREDAVRLLQERTEGLPARVEGEIMRWTRFGLARWEGERLFVDREALDTLCAGVAWTMPGRAVSRTLDGEPHLQELLCWLALAGHHLELPCLAQVMGEPLWRVEAMIDALVAQGLARRMPDQRVAARGPVDVRWSQDQRLEAHQAIAAVLRPGQEGRLFHLMAGEQVEQATYEAVEVARQRARAGDLGTALAALSEGLRVVRQLDGPTMATQETRILAEWVKVAFAVSTPGALDRVLYELTRVSYAHPIIEQLKILARAAIAAPEPKGLRAINQAGSIQFTDPELERWRHRTLVAAASIASAQTILEGKVLDALALWAAQSHEPLALLCLAEAQAILRYDQGRFGDAAALHAEAAAREPWLTGRIAQTLKCASALLEAFRHREAAQRALIGRDLAAQCRQPYWEGRAEWLLRAAMYRMGEAGPPDLELVEATARVGVPDLEATVCLNEAAVAFRTGDMVVAVQLADRAAQIWRELDRPGVATLARCLALACGATTEAGEVDVLAMQAIGCRISGIGIQALGLLGCVFPNGRPSWRDAVAELVADIPRQHWGQRLDVLSVNEALAGALGAAAQ